VESRAELASARRSNLAIALFGLALIALLVGRLWGPTMALSTLAIGTLDPGWIAQSRWATLDIIHGIGVALAILCLGIWRQSQTRVPLVGVGLSAVLATTAKFSGLMLGPLSFVVLLFGSHSTNSGRESPTQRLASAAKLGLIIGVSFLVGIGIVFNAHAVMGIGALGDGWTHLVQGVHTFMNIRTADTIVWLMGDFYPNRTMAYLPALIAAKTPITLLLMMLGGLLWRPARQRLAEHWPVLALAATWLLLSIFSSVNAGHRHLTPVLPFMWMVAAAGVVSVWERGQAGARAGAVAMLIVLGLEGWMAHPHYQPFTNLAFGGQDGAHRVAVSSASDWGQDLPALHQWLTEHSEGQRAHLAYYGRSRPAAWDIRHVWRPCSELGSPHRGGPRADCAAPAELLAISATCLYGTARVHREPDRCWERLWDVQPDAIVGGTILIFRDVPAEQL
jgi:hypothetical protein